MAACCFAAPIVRAAQPEDDRPPRNWVEAAAGAARKDAPGTDVTVFVVDSLIQDWFMRGGVPAEIPGSDFRPAHGSLVGRVIRNYCSAPIVSVPVLGDEDSVDRISYLVELANVLSYVQAHPDERILVNISLGSYRRDPLEAALVKGLVDGGALIIAAAGNDDSQELMYPAAYDGVVAVACATRSGKIESSNYGSHIAIAASGDITFIDYDFLPKSTLRREMNVKGTSFAAPEVTAMVAFTLEHNPEMSPREAFAEVRGTAVDVGDDLFEEGKLGEGLMMVTLTKGSIAPLYGLWHYVVPVMLLMVSVGFTILAILRWQWTGVAIAFGYWCVLVSFCLIVAIGWGYASVLVSKIQFASPCVYLINAAAFGVAVLILKGRVRRAFGIWFVVVIASFVLKLMGMAPMPRAIFVAAACVVWAGVLWVRTRRRIRRLLAVPDQMPAEEAGEFLFEAYHRTYELDEMQAARDALGRLPREVGDEYLERVVGASGNEVTRVLSMRRSEREQLEREHRELVARLGLGPTFLPKRPSDESDADGDAPPLA